MSEPEDAKAKLERLTGLDLSKVDDVTLFMLSEFQEVRKAVEAQSARIEAWRRTSPRVPPRRSCDQPYRLQTDVIDLYQSHRPDPDTPIEETLAAYDTLLKAGKVRGIGASKLDAAQLGEALTVAKQKNLPT